MPQIEKAAAFQIVRTSRLLRLHFSRFARSVGFDLSQEQWLIMNRLSENPNLSQLALGDSLIQDKPNITRILAGMVKLGLVKRKPDQNDRRIMRVRRSPQGRRVFLELSQKISNERRRVFAGLNQADLKRLSIILLKTQKNLAMVIERV